MSSLNRCVFHAWERSSSSSPTLQTEAFSATTDLYQIVANVYQMRFVPLDVPSVLFLVLVTLLPFIPLLLLAVPLDVVLKSLADFMV